MRRAVLIMSLVFIASQCFADGLGTLIEVGESMKEIAKHNEEETKSFEGVQRAIENGSIKEGQSKSSIREKYGEPVIATREADAREKWVYMPATSTFFKGKKIYLFFDERDTLAEIRVAK